MIHSYYLMVLQDFIVDRSSAHLDGFISSHWMSSSILRVEIRPEIKQTNKHTFFFDWEATIFFNSPSSQQRATLCRKQIMFFQHQPAASTSTSQQHKSSFFWDSARPSSKRQNAHGSWKDTAIACYLKAPCTRVRCSRSLFFLEALFLLSQCQTTEPHSCWVLPCGTLSYI